MLFREVVSAVAVGQQQRSVLAFYIKRLAHEQTTRIITGFLTLAVVIFQVLSVIAPPKITEASQTSSNDIRRGGFTDKADLLQKYDQDPELRQVYDRVGIRRQDIQAARDARVNTSQSAWTIGRNPHGDPKTNFKIDLPGQSTNLYLQPLANSGRGLSYHALAGVDQKSRKFWILRGSCNPVIETDVPTDQTPTLPTPSSRPLPTTVPVTNPRPLIEPPTCQLLRAYPAPDNPSHKPPYKVSFDIETKSKGDQKLSYSIDFGDGVNSKLDNLPIEHVFNKPGNYIVKASVLNSSTTSENAPSCSTVIDVSANQLANLKTAVNLSRVDKQGQPTNAASTTAQPGNEISYTLTVRNTGSEIYPNYSFQENLSDIVEYADIQGTNGGQIIHQLDGSGVSQTSLIWPAENILAGQSLSKSFVIKVKNPIPVTPRGLTDPMSYDLTMENYFQSNRVVIQLPISPIKQAEFFASRLPQTGSGLATAALGLFTLGAIFILIRNRFIAKELAIIATSGGSRSQIK